MKRISFIVFIYSVSHVLSQPVQVPLNHRVYDFLDRMQVKGMVPLLSNIYPYSRDEIAQAFVHIQGEMQKGKTAISRAEKEQFEQLKGEFFREFGNADIPVQENWHERNFLKWSEENHQASVDLLFDQKIFGWTGDVKESVFHTTGGGILKGQFFNRVGFFLYTYNTLRKGEHIQSEQFDPSKGSPITLSGKNAFSDDASAYFMVQFPHFIMEFGRDEAQWGPGRQGSLMLSKHEAFFDMLRLQLQFHRIRFISIHGKLNHSGATKFLAAHRLELQIASWFTMAGSELVIYGNRDIEPMYLNPLMPYHVAEHHLGDLDNNTIGFDMTIIPIHHHKIYFELFVDDFTTSKNPFTYYGNKWAILTGWHWADIFGLTGCDIQMEYTRIEPYVYTHNDSINVYQEYGRPIGHWIGPNSDDLNIQMNYLLSHALETSVFIKQIRHGEGDIFSPPDASISTHKQFLSGTVETTWETGVFFRYQCIRDGYIGCCYSLMNESNVNHQFGLHRNTQRFNLNFSINY